MSEKFCSGCRRYKPEHLIESKKVVVLPRGKVTHYLCGVCAEKLRVRKAQGAAA